MDSPQCQLDNYGVAVLNIAGGIMWESERPTCQPLCLDACNLEVKSIITELVYAACHLFRDKEPPAHKHILCSRSAVARSEDSSLPHLTQVSEGLKCLERKCYHPTGIGPCTVLLVLLKRCDNNCTASLCRSLSPVHYLASEFLMVLGRVL